MTTVATQPDIIEEKIPTPSYDKLENLYGKIKLWQFIGDSQEFLHLHFMPSGSVQECAKEAQEVKKVFYAHSSNPQIAELIQSSKVENHLSPWQEANLREIEKDYLIKNALNEDLIEEKTRIESLFKQKQKALKRENNITEYIALLKEMVEVKRKEGEAVAKALNLPTAYDGLLNDFQPGMTTSEIDSHFKSLEELPKMIKETIQLQSKKEYPDLHLEAPKSEQAALAMQLARTLGFNFKRGGVFLDDNAASSTGSPYNAIVKVRWDEKDFLRCAESTCHEVGHGMYRQCRPKEYYNQVVGEARSVMINEGIAFVFQRHICKHRKFREYLAKCANFGTFTGEELYQAGTRVQVGLNRIRSDELTYPAHIQIRYQIERDLIGGRLEVEDLPQAWNELTEKYLGITPGDDHAKGCMQDVHWSKGYFGYFPAYTLGAMFAAQMMEKTKEMLNIGDILSKGDIAPIYEILKDRVWSKGKFYETDSLIEHSTGKPFGAETYLKHLEDRYLREKY